MQKLIFWIVFVILAAIVIAFSVNNRTVLALDLWPAPYGIDLPVFAVALIGVLIGFVWGGIITWIGGGRTREKLRQQVREKESMARERAIVQEQLNRLQNTAKQASIPPPPADAA